MFGARYLVCKRRYERILRDVMGVIEHSCVPNVSDNELTALSEVLDEVSLTLELVRDIFCFDELVV